MNCARCGHQLEWHGPVSTTEGRHCAACDCPRFRTTVAITRFPEFYVEEDAPDGTTVGALYSDVLLILGTLEGRYNGYYAKQTGFIDQDDPASWRALLN